MKSKDDITIIIPAYSRPELLKQTLKSVFTQCGGLKLNVIVIDDHSPIPLKPLLQKIFPQVKFLRNPHNLRSGPTRNQALKYIDSPFVAFLDADDLWKPNFLVQSIKVLKQNPQSVASLSLSQPLFSPGLSLKFKIKLTILSAIRDSFQLLFYMFNHRQLPQSAFYLCQLSHLVFKSDQIKNQKFDPAYNYGGEDWKYVLQTMDHGTISIIPQALVRYRYHPQSSTHKKDNLKNKWNSYQQLFSELNQRNISGAMIYLFSKYISTFNK